MIYHDLAEYYDDLVKDEEATLRWADLTEEVLKDVVKSHKLML